ncbi:unnamed protein product, partial [Meganyctiphanes norvegica]
MQATIFPPDSSLRCIRRIRSDDNGPWLYPSLYSANVVPKMVCTTFEDFELKFGLDLLSVASIKLKAGSLTGLQSRNKVLKCIQVTVVNVEVSNDVLIHLLRWCLEEGTKAVEAGYTAIVDLDGVCTVQMQKTEDCSHNLGISGVFIRIKFHILRAYAGQTTASIAANYIATTTFAADDVVDGNDAVIRQYPGTDIVFIQCASDIDREEISHYKNNNIKGTHREFLIDFKAFLNNLVIKYETLSNRASQNVIAPGQPKFVGPQVSWSPSSSTNIMPVRPRLLTESLGIRPRNRRQTQSVRIKKWLSGKRNRKGPMRLKSRRISSSTRTRRKWSDNDIISSESDTCEDDIEESMTLESRLRDLSNDASPHVLLERHNSSLRIMLTNKGKPVLILNLLEAGRLTEAMNLARENQCRLHMDVCLLWACLHGVADMVEYMLNIGANVNAKNIEGFSTLHLAASASYGSSDVLEKLISAGAQINGPGEWDNLEEVTPLMLAAQNSNITALKVLIKAGATLDAGLHTHGETALHYAVQSASPDCVQLILDNGGSLMSTKLYSETPLHIAVSEGLSDITGILLRAGADVRALRGTTKMSSLHIAAQEGYYHIAHLLLKAKANPNHENSRGQTPLHLAAKAQCFDTVQVLLNFNADPNAQDCDMKTPLHSGIFKGSRSFDCLKKLLESGADPNIADSAGYTPLHLAALNNSTYCVMMFMRHGGDITMQTRGKVSALALILRNTPTVITNIQESLDNSISHTDHDHHDKDVKIIGIPKFRVLFFENLVRAIIAPLGDLKVFSLMEINNAKKGEKKYVVGTFSNISFE